MKKYILILLSVVVVLVVWIFLKGQARHMVSPVTGSQEISNVSHQSQKAVSIAATVNDTNTFNVAPAMSVAPAQPQQILNAIVATNLNQWKAALPNLQRLNPSDYEEAWILDEHDPNKYPSVLLAGTNGASMNYTTRFVDVQAMKPDEHIRKVEMKSPIMDIDEARDLGVKLFDIMGGNPKDFFTWCDQVRNHWLDAPLYGSGSTRIPDSNKFYGFEILRTYDDQKPWCINFFIVEP